MNDNNIEILVLALLEEYSNKKGATKEMQLNTLDVDGYLTLKEFAETVEGEFGILIPQDDFINWNTVDDVIQYVSKITGS